MLIVISPAKLLNVTSPVQTKLHSEPEFMDEAQTLVDILRELSPAEIAKLMSINDKLAVLGVTRMATFSRPFNAENAKQAIHTFDGAVYHGLNAWNMSDEDLQYTHEHLRVLSGLYGVLRPLDWMQPYRLEMGSKLANPAGKNLYEFWGDKITQSLNAQLNVLREGGEESVIIHLASDEYFKAVNTKKLNARIIQPIFKEWKNGEYKTVVIYTKRARGLMSRFIVDNRITQVEALKAFNVEGYAFSPAASDDYNWVFQRRV